MEMTKQQNLIGAVLAESILITMESNSIQMLSLSMTRGGENASVAIGIECETTRVSVMQPMLFVGRHSDRVDCNHG